MYNFIGILCYIMLWLIMEVIIISDSREIIKKSRYKKEDQQFYKMVSKLEQKLYKVNKLYIPKYLFFNTLMFIFGIIIMSVSIIAFLIKGLHSDCGFIVYAISCVWAQISLIGGRLIDNLCRKCQTECKSKRIKKLWRVKK